MITVKNYISFVGTMVLAFGVVFELPLVLMFLAKIGIATPEFLVQKRKYAVVIILIVSAFLTPPDLITQVIMAVPLIILYEVGIMAVKLTYRE
jgi:sec-independent protein translocase protein TatC